MVELAAAGWTALVIWEYETRDPQRLAALAASIKQKGKHMGRKETEKAIADSRADRVTRVGSVGELLAELNADDRPENLENWLHEKAGPAYDALKAAPARAVSADRVRYTLAELLAEAETSGQYPLPPEEREWVDAPAVGRELLPDDLQTVEAIAAFLAHAEASGDLDYIEHAREVAAQARAMHGLEG